MNIKKLLIVFASVFLIGCSGGGSTPATTSTYLTIAKEKENVSFKFVKSYEITDTQTIISSYRSELIDNDTKYKIDVTGGTNFSLLVSMNIKYDLKDTCFKYDGKEITSKTFIASSIRYYAYDVNTLQNKDVELSFTYEVYIPDIEVTIGKFLAPTVDPNNLYSSLFFNAEVNGEVVKYNNNEKILASNLETALKALGSSGKIKVNADKGIKLIGFFEKDDYFFNDALNISELSKTEKYIYETKADYVDFKSIYEIKPSTSCNFYLDFANLATKEYSKYTVRSYFGRSMETKINYKEILVDGNPVSELTNNTIKNANKVLINYEKEAFGLEDLSAYNNAGSEISQIKYSSGEKSRLIATKDTLSVVIKDSSSENTPAIYWYSGWLDGSSDKRHNLIDKKPCNLDIVIYKIA